MVGIIIIIIATKKEVCWYSTSEAQKFRMHSSRTKFSIHEQMLLVIMYTVGTGSHKIKVCWYIYIYIDVLHVYTWLVVYWVIYTYQPKNSECHQT